MSYCRDPIYVYRHADGWSIHVDREITYHEKTAAEFRDRLYTLRAEGIEVPQRAIDRIEREIAEGKWKS